MNRLEKAVCEGKGLSFSDEGFNEVTFEENTWRLGEREEVCLGNSNERALWLLACLACAVKAVTECHEPGGEQGIRPEK